jgi:restriction system protein
MDLTGTDFEHFLAQLFQRQGYTVQRTGQSGDQGVDLILIRPDGWKIAVQAKGYIVSSVGNNAVREAFTGQAFYDCQECWVVTTSRYTKKAQEVADKVGCRLFDKHDISLWLRELGRQGHVTIS